MADEDRTAVHRVAWLAELERAPYEFDLHAALRHLECLFRDKPRFGTAAHPSDEPIRMAQDPGMGFVPAPLAAFQNSETGPLRLTNAILGLFGPHGPLPFHLTEYARERMRNLGDKTFVAFADLFHHRILMLFHRAWAVGQPAVAQDRPESSRFDTYMGAVFGLGQPGLRNRDEIQDQTKLYYAGRLACPSRNAEGLEAIVSDYFALPAKLEQFIGEWVDLPEQARWHLGGARDESLLGRSTILGARGWVCDHKFRIVLGPLTRQQFRHFLPGGSALVRLGALVKMYVGDEFAWDVRLVLAPDQGDQICLRGGSRLGWNARLGGGSDYDLIIEPRTGRTFRMPHRPQPQPEPRAAEKADARPQPERS